MREVQCTRRAETESKASGRLPMHLTVDTGIVLQRALRLASPFSTHTNILDPSNLDIQKEKAFILNPTVGAL